MLASAGVGATTAKTTKRLLNELHRIQANCATLGFQCAIVENDLHRWRISISHQLNGTPLKAALEIQQQEVIEGRDITLEIVFGSRYPLTPPSLRLLEPRLLPSPTIPCGGSLSLPILSEKTWTPITTVQAIVDEFRAILVAENIQAVAGGIPYSQEEALSGQEGFYLPYQARLPNNKSIDDSVFGGKIVLPASALQLISSLPSAEFPLVFELADMARRRTTHAGVIDFSAPEDIAIAPTWIFSNLGVEENEFFTARMVHLPKGQYLKLKPKQIDFYKLSQPKEMLESVLRSFVAISEGDSLQIKFDDNVFDFDVLETRPGPAINISNTDVEVEFFDNVNENEGSTGHGWSPASEVAPESAPATSTGHVLSTDGVLAETIQCDNCLRKVPVASLSGHQAFCKRNNMMCDRCHQVIRIADKQSHEQEMHSLVTCVCNAQIERYLLSTHKSHDCLQRLIECKFCKLNIKFFQLDEHEKVCGTRTEKCDKCSKFIKLKDWDRHQQSSCKFPAPLPTSPRQPPRQQEPSFGAKVLNFFGFGT